MNKFFPLNYFPVFISLLLISFLSSFALAETITINRTDPKAMVIQSTDELLKIANEAKSYVKTDKARYYREGESILNQVIDRQYFARSVMATYASARQYNALKTETEKQAFRNRVERFADSMQEVLIGKYADALLLFNGQRIEIESVLPVGDGKEKVNVKQLIYGEDNQIYTVQYNLHKDDQNLWLLYNVVVEGVNLGSTFRNQFSEAVEKNKGDIDYVINHWAEIMSQGETDNAK